MAPAPFARAAIPVFAGLFVFFTPFSIAGAHLSLAAALLCGVLDPEARAQAGGLARRHPLARPVLLWCAVSVLAVLFAEDPASSVVKLKKLALLPLLALGALASVRRALRPILTTLIASAAVVSIWGLAVHVAHGGGLEARLRGISGFYMTVAGILMIVGLLCVGELLAALKDPHARRIAFLSVSGALVLVALLATYTRGSWIGFAAGALFLLRKRWVALATLGLVVATLFALGPPDGRERFLSIFEPGHPRNVERVLIWKHGLHLVRERPWTGTGLVIPPELMRREVVTENGVIRVHSHMHNAYLQIAVSMGLPALGVFAWLAAAFFRMGRRAARSRIHNLWEEGLVAAYPAILLALLVNGLFEWNFGDSEILGLFYFLSGCALGIEQGSGA